MRLIRARNWHNLQGVFTGAILGLLRRFVGGRSAARDWAEWASRDPAAAAIQLDLFASFARHRAEVISRRRFVLWRKKHRVNRWQSAADQLEKLADQLAELARTTRSD